MLTKIGYSILKLCVGGGRRRRRGGGGITGGKGWGGGWGLWHNGPPSFRMEYLIFVQISKILIKFQRAFERISYNDRDVDPNFRYFDQNLTL